MKLHVLLAVLLLCLSGGCASQRRTRGASDAQEPAPAPQRTAAPSVEAPDVSGPFGLELKAEQAVGRVGSTIAVLRQRLGKARRERDVVQTQCINDKLLNAERLERAAEERRSALRDAMLEDNERAAQELRSLEGMESDARRLLSEANHCIGGEAMYAVQQSSSSGIGGLFRRTEALRERTMRTKARMSLSSETTLAGRVDRDGDGLVDMVDSNVGTMGALPGTGTAASRGPAPTTAKPAVQGPAPHDPSMLVHTAVLTLGVNQVEKSIDAVEAAAKQAGGYLANRGDRRIVMRVPRERFAEVLRAIEKLGDVLHRNVVAEDVTDQYTDLELRLRNARVVRARLEALLASATVHDAVEIHKQLAKITEEIERLEGKLKLLRDRIAWSTITVTLEKLQEHTVHEQALLPFPWMNVIGLWPLMTVPR